MQEKQLFEYAVIRIVPRVDREEFLNVGVVLFCPRLKFLELIYTLDKPRLLAFASSLDVEELSVHLAAFSDVVRGGAGSGPIGLFDLAGRFRWLTAQRSTVLQTSKVHPGFCAEPAEALKRLHEALVL
jgi:Protein of unknown function (DUF3037)